MMTNKSSDAAIVVFFSLLTALCRAEMWTTVYYADGITPLPRRDPNIPDVYVDVMVGAHLSIIVNSNQETPLWAGRLDISEMDGVRGQLWPCDYNESTYNGEESCSILPAAQSKSGLSLLRPSLMRFGSNTGHNFITMTGTNDPNIGEWFAIDYHAIGLGECTVTLSEQIRPDLPLFTSGPVQTESHLISESMFTHVQTRDFDGNHRVDFIDFALMAPHLQNPGTSDPNLSVDPNDFAFEYDFDQNLSIDATDLAMFMDFWLARKR